MDQTSQQATLSAAINQNSTRLIEILSELVSYETIAPPARNTKPLQNWIGDFLVQHGFEVERTPFYQDDLLINATKPGSDPNAHDLILNGHVDVAPVGNLEHWQTNPFELVQDDDQLIGRGTDDMKGARACFLYLVELLDQEEINLPGTLKIQSVVGEELGEAGTKTLLANGQRADFAIVGDNSDLELQGQGGVITGWIILKSPQTFHDGNRVKMVATGGGLEGANMIEKMMVVIKALNQLEHYWGVTKTYPGFVPGTNTINPAYIEGGIHPAFVPNQCRLWITVHLYPNERPETVTQEIEAAVRVACQADPWLQKIEPQFECGGDSMLVDQGEVFLALPLGPNHSAI